MITRSDKNSPQTEKVYFSDFLNDFDSHPLYNTLVNVTNENAVKQSIRNLILTNLGERLFQPTIGSDVVKSLFEPNDIVTAENITFYIKNTIKQNEPRALLLNVIVTPNSNADSFDVSIVFSLVNNTKVQTLDLILRRVR